jgi:23S rRNA (cytidine2498-2'-O)-methyltransferase
LKSSPEKPIRLILPIPKLEAELRRELHAREIQHSIGDQEIKAGTILTLETEYAGPLYWTQADYGHFDAISFSSISEAVKILKKKQKERGVFVRHLSYQNHRRGELIAEAFRIPKTSRLSFPDFAKAPLEKTFAFTLKDQNTLLIARENRAGPLSGAWEFNEDKTSAPSRAYLKLWEAFSRFHLLPAVNDSGIDLGSCPGGWTWVLSEFCQKVVSVDGASIIDALLENPKIEFLKRDAFTLDPNSFLTMTPRLRWICSDMICEPEKLLGLVKNWMEAFPEANFICTLKFKGPSSFATIDAFAKIPGSSIVHLSHNKHELTWVRRAGRPH